MTHDGSAAGTLTDAKDYDKPGAPGLYMHKEGSLKAVEVLNTNHLTNLIKDAAAEKIRLWPGGGGRCGPLEPGFDVLLDMRRQHRILDWDAESGVVHVESGVTWGQLEAACAERGASLSGWRREHPDCTIGGLLAAYQPTQHALWNGSVREACIGLGAVTGNGDAYNYLPAPRKAAGPDLRYLFIGGAGAYGVIAAAHLGVSARVERSKAYTVPCATPAEALGFIREAHQFGLRTPHIVYSHKGGAVHLLLQGHGDTVALMSDIVRRAAERSSVKASPLDVEAYYQPARGDLRTGADPITGRDGGDKRGLGVFGSLHTLAALPEACFEVGVLYDVCAHHAALWVPRDDAAGLFGKEAADARTVWVEGGRVLATSIGARSATKEALLAIKKALDPAGILPAAM